MKIYTNDTAGTAVVLIALGVVLISMWAGFSYFEAKAFTRNTGREVTTWDAMFLQLRVVDPYQALDKPPAAD